MNSGIDMFNVTLFCTKHGEAGNCNVIELYKIINALTPEIIFEEIPPCIFDEYYKHMTSDKLESNAIKLYLSDHDIKQIPVDLDVIMSQSFWKNNRNMFEQIERENYNFRKLCDYDDFYSRTYGFNYLNSVYCENIYINMYNEMEATIKNSNKKGFIDAFEEWNRINEERENEMVSNIYNYCTENLFDKGLFMIGSAHRKSIINKIKIHTEKEKVRINWNYFEYDNNKVNIITV